MLKRCIVLYAQDAFCRGAPTPTTSTRTTSSPLSTAAAGAAGGAGGAGGATEDRKYEALHALSKRGSSGLLVWRKTKSRESTSSAKDGAALESLEYPNELNQLAQILGGEHRTDSLAEEFKQAKCLLLSNSTSAREAFAGAFAASAAFDASADDDGGRRGGGGGGGALVETLDKLVEEQEPDLIFIHLKLAGLVEKESETNPIQVLDGAVKLIVDKFVDDLTMFVLLVGDGQNQQDYGIDLLVRDKTQQQQQQQHATSSPSPINRIVPRIPKQSFQFSDGELIEDWCGKGMVLAIRYSPLNHVRKDRVEEASPTEAYRKGGSGVTLAIHFMKGIMYNLMKASKYGA